ncbi:ATP-binding protein [Streptomyces sp. NPDC047023]|uniref:ATP-binding protein n=1 Tax=Streptomyces sp. NPDC047023 TaxID=3155139 RepID=UPI0033F71CA8
MTNDTAPGRPDLDHRSAQAEAHSNRPTGQEGRPALGSAAAAFTMRRSRRTTMRTAPACPVCVTAGGYTLTVNPADSTEISPSQQLVPAPVKRSTADRALQRTLALAPTPPGPKTPALPLLERDTERSKLTSLLRQGRSARLTGPAGSGRTALLDALAEDCAALAPDGVIRLAGRRRTATELLHQLYADVHVSDCRPALSDLLHHTAQVRAIVFIDDIEFGGPALDQLLRATPHCSYLLAASTEVPPPSPETALDEVPLAGLSQNASLELLAGVLDRALTEEETAWAREAHAACAGIPQRIVQAASALRIHRRIGSAGSAAQATLPALPQDVPHLLFEQLSQPAHAVLRFAHALDGEVPHHAHLPELLGDTRAGEAVGELLALGLLTASGPRYRLAHETTRHLTESHAGQAFEDLDTPVRTAASHYTRWAQNPSTTAEQIAAEADAISAALAGAETAAAVALARTVAPAFAACLHWGAWEQVLRIGIAAARHAADAAGQAYFHHELGVLALCNGRPASARAEFETAISLRGTLADTRGTSIGRRALALTAPQQLPPGNGGASLDPPAPPQEPTLTTPVPTGEPAAAPDATAPSVPHPPTPLVASRPDPKEPTAASTSTAAAAPPATPAPTGAERPDTDPAREPEPPHGAPGSLQPATAPTPQHPQATRILPRTRPTPPVPPHATAPPARHGVRRRRIELASVAALGLAALGTVIAIATQNDAPAHPDGRTSNTSPDRPRTGSADNARHQPASGQNATPPAEGNPHTLSGTATQPGRSEDSPLLRHGDDTDDQPSKGPSHPLPADTSHGSTGGAGTTGGGSTTAPPVGEPTTSPTQGTGSGGTDPSEGSTGEPDTGDSGPTTGPGGDTTGSENGGTTP